MSGQREKLEALFSRPELLQRALTHKSYANELKVSYEHNEKLEFLGDAVLDLVVGEYLYERFPQDTEGNLSKKRASVVNEEILSEVATRLGLHELLLLGKGEAQTGGAYKPRLLASGFEAVLGSLYLDRGFEMTRDFIRQELKAEVDKMNEQIDFERDYKTRLQEAAQRAFRETPTYFLLSEEGPPHERVFKVCVKVKDESLAVGQGKSKKIAEQMAAQTALENHFKEKN